MKREVAKQPLNVGAKTVATVDNLLAKQISRREPSGSDRRLTFSYWILCISLLSE